METLHFSIVINAPKEKVWKTMLEDKTYREWTNVFNPVGGCYYEGGWSTGSDIKFLGPDKDGNIGGMISRIKENRPYDFISIQHLGEINKGQINMWASTEAYENYTLNDKNGATELLIDLDSPVEFKEMKAMFEDMWPKALEKLKQLAEK